MCREFDVLMYYVAGICGVAVSDLKIYTGVLSFVHSLYGSLEGGE